MEKVHCIVYAVCIMFLTNRVSCDYYTSVVGLDSLLTAENVLVDYFEHYLQQAELTSLDVETVLEGIEENILKAFGDLESEWNYFENPLNAFKTIRRLVADWPQITDGAKGVVIENELDSYVANLETEYTKPSVDDLRGAIKGLLRLQNTYALHTEDIARGILNDRNVSSELSASDCYEIGRILVEMNEFNFAGKWLMQARTRWVQEQSNIINETHSFGNTTEIKILENLAPVLSILGHHKLASKLNEELLTADPNNKFGLENKSIYLERLVNERRKLNLEGEIEKEVPEEKLDKIKLFEQTCRGELRRSPSEERKFHCRYTHNNVPFCFIAPFKVEEISFDPFVVVYYDAIYDNEINQIISIANETVERSKVGDLANSQFSDIRTSKNTWLWFHENSFMDKISVRLTDITGLSLETAEALQVANYGIGGHYGPHHDFSEEASTYGDRGNRILTALFYINNVQMGGGTAFPYLRILVPPTKRSLLVWFNMHESLEVDYRTLHAGCPVLKGSKWICNEWFHERGQEFRRPCSTEQFAYRSIAYKNK